MALLRVLVSRVRVTNILALHVTSSPNLLPKEILPLPSPRPASVCRRASYSRLPCSPLPVSCPPEPLRRLGSLFLPQCGPSTGSGKQKTPAGASSSRPREGKGAAKEVVAAAGRGAKRPALRSLPSRLLGLGRGVIFSGTSPCKESELRPSPTFPPPAWDWVRYLGSRGLGDKKYWGWHLQSFSSLAWKRRLPSALPSPAAWFSRLRPLLLTRFLLLPTTLFSWMCPVPSGLFPADLPPPHPPQHFAAKRS